MPISPKSGQAHRFRYPLRGKYSLIGTTDIEFKGDIEEVSISWTRVEYLCTRLAFLPPAGQAGGRAVTTAGVRPLSTTAAVPPPPNA